MYPTFILKLRVNCSRVNLISSRIHIELITKKTFYFLGVFIRKQLISNGEGENEAEQFMRNILFITRFKLPFPTVGTKFN